MSDRVTSEQLIDAVECAGYDVRSYSGRGMYGSQCVAFTTDDNEAYAAAQIVGSIEDSDEREAMITVFRGVRSDSMGRSTVIYFPRMVWPADRSENIAESDDE